MQVNAKRTENDDLLAGWRITSAPESPCVSLSTEQSPYLGIAFSDGEQIAFPYSQITRIEFNPSIGITVFLYRGKLVVRGRNLLTVYEELLSERVAKLSQLREDPIASEGIPWVSLVDFQPDVAK